MVKLINLFPVVNIWEQTNQKAKGDNSTKWISTYRILLRYLKIHNYLGLLHLDDISEMVLKQTEINLIESMYALLGDLDSIKKLLQQDDIIISDIRQYFDAVLEEHSSTSSRLSKSRNIVKEKYVESAIVKLQRHRFEELLVEEIWRLLYLLERLDGTTELLLTNL